MIIDGSDTNTPTDFPGLTIESDHNIIRGLAIDGFSAGISIQGPGAIGNLIQGNYLGQYLVFPNPSINHCAVICCPGSVTEWASRSARRPTVADQQLGRRSVARYPQRHRWQPRAGCDGDRRRRRTDNQVVGNLIGVLEQDATPYYQVGNGAEGVLVESPSNLIGGDVAGATNVISANQTDGIHIEGPGALDNRVEGNYIGTDINGTFLFGQGDPGNGQDGIFIDDAPDNQIGIPGGTDGVGNVAGNVISDNIGAGVSISGTSATGNIIQGNVIGTNLSRHQRAGELPGRAWCSTRPTIRWAVRPPAPAT